MCPRSRRLWVSGRLQRTSPEEPGIWMSVAWKLCTPHSSLLYYVVLQTKSKLLFCELNEIWELFVSGLTFSSNCLNTCLLFFPSKDCLVTKTCMFKNSSELTTPPPQQPWAIDRQDFVQNFHSSWTPFWDASEARLLPCIQNFPSGSKLQWPTTAPDWSAGFPPSLLYFLCLFHS